MVETYANWLYLKQQPVLLMRGLLDAYISGRNFILRAKAVLLLF